MILKYVENIHTSIEDAEKLFENMNSNDVEDINHNIEGVGKHFEQTKATNPKEAYSMKTKYCIAGLHKGK